jgi:hypothetical protein
MPIDVSRTGAGHEIESSGRMIEVKGVSESWKTYTWQSLHASEKDCLGKDKANLFLHIVKFDGSNSSLYVIPGERLSKDLKFKVTAYALTPIRRKKLKEFLQEEE